MNELLDAAVTAPEVLPKDSGDRMNIKFRLSAVIQVPFLLLAGCASSPLPGPVDRGASLKLTPTSDEMLIEIQNRTTHDIILKNIDGLSLLPGQPGFDFEVFDESRKQHVLCSMIEPGVSSQMTVLKSGNSKQVRFSRAFISRIYCLDSGTYTVQAILLVPGRLTTVASNRVLLDVSAQ